MDKLFRPRLTEEEYLFIQKIRESNRPAIVNKDGNRVLVIGDLHIPFTLDEYLTFCKSIQKKYNTNKTIFIGDILDNNFSSFHQINPDGMSAGDELEVAKYKVSRWYEAFPDAVVIIGNHDKIPIRKAAFNGLSRKWIKSLDEVLDTPGWRYTDSIVIDDVLYVHGDGRNADTRSKNDRVSVVQGHWHLKGYVIHNVGLNDRTFSMQVGCGINKKSYAMGYAKYFGQPHISCGVILDDGRLPILEYMD